MEFNENVLRMKALFDRLQVHDPPLHKILTDLKIEPTVYGMWVFPLKEDVCRAHRNLLDVGSGWCSVVKFRSNPFQVSSSLCSAVETTLENLLHSLVERHLLLRWRFHLHRLFFYRPVETIFTTKYAHTFFFRSSFLRLLNLVISSRGAEQYWHGLFTYSDEGKCHSQCWTCHSPSSSTSWSKGKSRWNGPLRFRWASISDSTQCPISTCTTDPTNTRSGHDQTRNYSRFNPFSHSSFVNRPCFSLVGNPTPLPKIQRIQVPPSKGPRRTRPPLPTTPKETGASVDDQFDPPSALDLGVSWNQRVSFLMCVFSVGRVKRPKISMKKMYDYRKPVLNTWANSFVGIVPVLCLGFIFLAVGRLETLIADRELPNEKELLMTVSGLKQVKQRAFHHRIDRDESSIRLDCLCFGWSIRYRPGRSERDSQRPTERSQKAIKARRSE